MRTRILIVDDEKLIRESLYEALEDENYYIEKAENGEDAMLRIKKASLPFNVVITDLKMNAVSGFDLLVWVKKYCEQTDVVIITAFGTVENAVAAMKDGANDYITKPIDIFRLRTIIRKIVEKQDLVVENIALKRRVGQSSSNIVVGNSDAITEVYDIVSQVADTDASILIEGESGTGKEVVAQTIHNRSSRKQNPFVVVNCAALPTTLLENELFGHEREAFTGASSLKKGRFEQADGGTIFLDEITEMSLENQSGFLRVLEDGCFHRIGGSDIIRVDVRIIAASNRDVHQSCEDGIFRFDLYYRLNVVPIYVPPLRNRKEDVPLLAQAFLDEFSLKYKKSDLDISDAVIDKLRIYDWPGNIRELRNTLERAVILTRENRIEIAHLPATISGMEKDIHANDFQSGMSIRDMETVLIEKTLENVNGHRRKAAEMLGISVRALQYKIKDYKLNS